MNHHPVHVLQAAARAYAAIVLPGATPRRVVIYDDHGERIVEVRLHSGIDAPTPQPFEPPEVRAGWDFARKVPRFDGVERPEIAGRSLAVLRVLAEARDPVGVDELRKTWDGYNASDSTIRGAVLDLRKRLQALWPDWEGDVISSTGAGYVLEIR